MKDIAREALEIFFDPADEYQNEMVCDHFTLQHTDFGNCLVFDV